MVFRRLSAESCSNAYLEQAVLVGSALPFFVCSFRENIAVTSIVSFKSDRRQSCYLAG